jgi:poly-gamma-glutamate synthesis protein (capsule biosynthesis protein)
MNSSGAGESSEIVIVLTGDIMTARGVEAEIDEHNDIYYPFRGIGELTKRGDITFGNLETTISERGEPLNKAYTFRAGPETLQGVKDAGFDVLSLANNHICDFGTLATEDTIAFVEGYGIKHVGLWYIDEEATNARITRPVVIEAKGVRFAFLGYGENLPVSFTATDTKPAPVPLIDSVMKADIEYAKSIADIVIVAIHWARLPQYVKVADAGQIELCHRLSDYGADILANHGPHVLQEVENYNNSLIFYSLGNTVFDLANRSSHESMIATVYLDGKDFKKLELIPIVKNAQDQYIPRGNILMMDVTDELLLDWTDYQTKMFNSDDLISDYSGVDENDGNSGASNSELEWIVPVIIGSMVIGLALVILFMNRIRKRKTDK